MKCAAPNRCVQLARTWFVFGVLTQATGHPSATCREVTLRELELHIRQAAAYYSAGSLTACLHLFAARGLQPSPETAEAACGRLAAILHRQQEQQRQQAPDSEQQAVPFSTLAQVLWELATLQLSHPPLLSALLPALSAALARQGRGGALPAWLLQDVVSVAGSLGTLQATGLLLPAEASADALLPLWGSVMGWVSYAADSAAQAGGSAGSGLAPSDALILKEAAAQLNGGLAAGQAVFFLPVAAQRALASQRLAPQR